VRKNVPIIFTEHHESHAASCFFPSPFNEAAFLTIDGVGEWATSSYGVGKNNKIQMWGEQKFPHSLGLLYSAFTYYTGFKVNSGEYKVMGLAPYGEPKYVQKIYDHLIDVKEDGSFRLNLEYFNFVTGLEMTNEKFHKLFGGNPRRQESKMTQKTMDLARSIQVVTEDIMLKMAHHIRNETKQKNLCLAGGVALNCVANKKLLDTSGFEKLWIQPAAGDSGGALGAALFAWYDYLENKRVATKGNDDQNGSLLGPSFTNEEIERYLKAVGAHYSYHEKSEMLDTTVEAINDQKVVGWFQGRLEFGPRALGNRSILGDARSPKMQTVMNVKIKLREGFRPFAPSVLAEKASDYFDIDVASPYMLLIAEVREKYRLKLSKKEDKSIMKDLTRNIEKEILLRSRKQKIKASVLRMVIDGSQYSGIRGGSPKMILEWLATCL
jgi:carbamoyltransferase